MQRQIDLASENGVDGFIFDTYIGRKDGRPVKEAIAPLDNAFLGSELGDFKFAIMSVLGSPRAVLPVPKDRGFEESGRYYDRTRGTIEEIVDHAVKNYWDEDNYIRMTGANRPYMSLFTSDMRAVDYDSEDDLTLPESIEYLKEYSYLKYRIEPYLAVVCLRASHALPLIERGADAMTGYAFLPDFKGEPIQDYRKSIDQRILDWDTISEQISKPYIPPVVVGWDASPRGYADENTDIRDVAGLYPYTPIVEGANDMDFRRMLRLQRDYMERKSVPISERYTPITAWNEVTEGAALLPKVTRDGRLDKRLLEAVRDHKGR